MSFEPKLLTAATVPPPWLIGVPPSKRAAERPTSKANLNPPAREGPAESISMSRQLYTVAAPSSCVNTVRTSNHVTQSSAA
ncbi:hypothetical protein GCM10009769_05910 [Curtobacterium luteum]|uniref:Uncharacterized protein n=1 Tax=Curtobacterium luteum TaxID=33881 RepID=A0A8H9KXX4_9MICO|nr:hypothetical protein GCM10009769_05910 [Curtobacterium luteum]